MSSLAALNWRNQDMPGFEGYRKIEKMDGIIYDMSPSADYRHGRVNANIMVSLANQLKGSLCQAYMENLDLYISEDEWLIPDIMIICNKKDIVKNIYRGVPKFVVETASPSTANRDRTKKMRKYASIGVPEFWIVHPRGYFVEIYYLLNGEYEIQDSYILETDPDAPEGDYNADTVIHLREFPHISIKLTDIFEGVEW